MPIAPGFFSSDPVHLALAVGCPVSVVCAAVGVFTVIRGQAFAGHSLADIDASGGSGAILIGIGPLWGFVGLGLVAAAGMEVMGARRPRSRDVTTGVVLGAAIGLAALFLYLDSTQRGTTGAATSILFGSLFSLQWSIVPWVLVLSALALASTCLLYRPLLLSSVHGDLAAARGVPVRSVGLAFLFTMSLGVSLSALTVGAILSTALLIGPAAAARRLTRRPGAAVAVAAACALVATCGGIALSYASYAWPPVHQGWPVSFLIVALVFTIYLVSAIPAIAARRHDRRSHGAPEEASCSRG